MNKLDGFLKRKAEKDNFTVPENVKKSTEHALALLPEETQSTAKPHFPKLAYIAACLCVFCFLIMPNCSTAYAEAMERIPVIGSIVKVVTIRNYFYTDERHEMNIDVPKIESDLSGAADFINKDVDELTKILVDRFNSEVEEIGNRGYSALYVDYEVVTNTDSWFTLKIRVHEAAGSSNTYYKYYHINKKTDKIVKLSDLALNDEFYTVMENDIRRQMNERMANDPELIYWSGGSEFGWDFVTLDKDHNFYWDADGNLVIAFDKYEVAPGSMGTPEFTVNRKLISDFMKNCDE